MRMDDFARGACWAIQPEAFELLTQALMRMEPAALEKLAADTAAVPDLGDFVRVEDGVAIIPVSGALSKRAGYIDRLFGEATSYVDLAREVAAAARDARISAIVLDIDSPGGTVSGVESVANLVYAARERKPVVAYANGRMASAAYWIGSAANSVIAEPSATVGSIGVLMTHIDLSRAAEQFGVKVTYLTAGKYKALGNMFAPLGDDAKRYFGRQLEQLYGLFVDAVARHRGVDADTVRERMADGRTFIGAEAVERGLASRLGDLQSAIDLALTLAGDDSSSFNGAIAAGAAPPADKRSIAMPDDKTPKIESVADLTAAYPQLVKEIRDEAAAAGDNAVDAATERVLGLAAIQFGAEPAAKLRAVVETGVTVAQFEAVRKAAGVEPAADAQAAADDKDAAFKEEMLAAVQSAGADNPGAGARQQTPAPAGDYMTLVEAYQRETGCTRVEALQAVMRSHPESHAKYLQSVN